MVTSLAADLPSRCCLFNNCAKIYNCTSENANKDSTSIFLLLVIVMESMKSNVSVNYVEGIQQFSAISGHHDSQIIIPNYRFSVNVSDSCTE